MGVHQLWKLIKPISEIKSFRELAIREGFEDLRHGTGIVVVGVDVKTWFYEAALSSGRRVHGLNAELRVLFFRLAELSRSTAQAVFVFDGPRCPEIKRRKAAVPHWLTSRFAQLVRAFGFHCHIAPGEAEAELAYLNQIHAIDLVLTSDSGIFLFGATHVIRRSKDSCDPDLVEVYAPAQGPESEKRFPPRSACVFMAITNGGDYTPNGLPLEDCRLKIALTLGFSPLAISLYDAVQNLSSSALDLFLIGWRNKFQHELLNDPQGRLGRIYPSFARQIPNSFPEPKALQLYCCPLTSQADLSFTPNYLDWLVPGIPSTEELAALCDSFFGWGPDILKYMANYVWEGQFVRQLIQERFKQVPVGTKLSPTLGSPSIQYISGTCLKIKTATCFGFYKVQIWVSSVASKAFNSIQDRYPPATIHGGIISMTVLVPEPILQAMAPGLVEDFHTSHPQIIDRTRPTYDPILSIIQVSHGGGELPGQINDGVLVAAGSAKIII